MWPLRRVQNLLFSHRFLHSSAAAASTTTTTTADSTHFMVNYLIDSLGFSTNEAISASSKVTRLKSSRKPDSVIDLFRRYGFEDAHIKSVVHSIPEVLSNKPAKTLEPKLAVFHGLGLSGPELAELLSKNKGISRLGLDTSIEPMIRYLRELLGRDEHVVKAIKRSSWLLTSARSLKRLRSNVQLFRDCGLPNDKIQKYLVLCTRVFTFPTELLENTILRVEDELHIPRDSGMFFYGVSVLCSIPKPKLEMKFGIFRSYGWADSDIHTLARSQPRCLSLSDANLRNVLNYHMKDLGFTSAYLATRAQQLMMSLERRVKPRVEVLKILEGSKVGNLKMGLNTVFMYSETKFVEKCILRYTKEMPDLLETYTKIMKQ